MPNRIKNVAYGHLGATDKSFAPGPRPAPSLIHLLCGRRTVAAALTAGLLVFLAACAPQETPTPTAEPTVAVQETAATETPPPPQETPAPPNGTATLTPLVVDEPPADCPIESNIDLAGYMDIEERMGCAIAPAKFDPVAINEFGPGPDYDRFMLWFASEGNIYALLPDGSYQVFADEWQEGDEVFTCNPLDGEAESPPLPRRGFGKIWCEHEEIQEALGLIEREERLCQHAVDQPFERGRLLACFEDASVRYFRILNDGAWDVTLQ